MQLPFRVEPKEALDKAFNEILDSHKRDDLFLAFFDGNSIKKINDTYGHVMGDKVIFSIAQSILACIRSDDRVFRFGGDEFVLVLPNFKEESIKPFIHRIQNKVKTCVNIVDEVGEVSISAGVVKFDPDVHFTLEKFIHEADMLMYSAKKRPPEYARFSIDPDAIQQIKEKRLQDILAVRKRSFFTWVVAAVSEEVPVLKVSDITEACREVWRINGNKVLYKATPNEVVNMVISASKYLKKNKKITIDADYKLSREASEKEINDIKDILNKMSKKEIA